MKFLLVLAAILGVIYALYGTQIKHALNKSTAQYDRSIRENKELNDVNSNAEIERWNRAAEANK